MAFKRNRVPDQYRKGDALTRDLISIGFYLGGSPSIDANIEDTLVAASIEGIGGSHRTLAILTEWFSVHHYQVLASRLTYLICSFKGENAKAVQVYWCANAQRVLRVDSRFSKLARLYPSSRFNFITLVEGKGGIADKETDYFISERGEDPRFQDTCLRIPNEYLRSRASDVRSPRYLAKRHIAYRYRLVIGPEYRADMWAALRRNPKLRPSEIARLTYGCCQTAMRVYRDYQVVKRDYSQRKKAA